MFDNARIDQAFQYRGCEFLLQAQETEEHFFLPRVFYQSGLPGIEPMTLQADAEPYGSEAEAWRHAQQQAVRWVHDRTGDGQGRF